MKTPILTEPRISELVRIAEAAVTMMEQNPQAFTGPPEEIWKQHFLCLDGPGRYDTAGSGDVGTPSKDGDQWREDSLETEVTRDEDGSECIRFYSVDSDGDSETETWVNGNERTDAWAQETLVMQSLFRHCIYVLLKQQLYNLDCITTGRDPLGWVYPERKKVAGTVDVGLRADGTTSAALVNGSPAVIQTATRYVAYRKDDPRTFEELEEVIAEHPNGRPLDQDDDRTRGWRLIAHDPGKSALLRVQICDTVQKYSARHIREVYSKDAEKEVLDYAATVIKTVELEKGVAA